MFACEACATEVGSPRGQRQESTISRFKFAIGEGPPILLSPIICPYLGTVVVGDGREFTIPRAEAWSLTLRDGGLWRGPVEAEVRHTLVAVHL